MIIATILSLVLAAAIPTTTATTRVVKFAWYGQAYMLEWGSVPADALYGPDGHLAAVILHNDVGVLTTGPIAVTLPPNACYVVAVGDGGVSNVVAVPAL